VPATLADGTILRPLVTHDERARAVRLQDDTWGAGFSERVPAAILMIAEKIGGIAVGAFAPDDTLLGFVFGLTGVKDGALVHWSDMLAVRPDARGRHLGEALKHYQRERCRALGIVTMFWTFDPFVARNAHLNLNRLGATVSEFIPDMYGETGSHAHALGTDRFVAAWPVQSEPVPMHVDATVLAGMPLVAGDAVSTPSSFPAAASVAVPIPHDLTSLVSTDLSRAKAWHQSARRAFQHYLHSGYHVTAFVPGGPGNAHYVFSRDA
jgi:predicted GNAT superfamily acetyltransferase